MDYPKCKPLKFLTQKFKNQFVCSYSNLLGTIFKLHRFCMHCVPFIYDIPPREPPLQASSSLTQEIRIWSINNLFHLLLCRWQTTHVFQWEPNFLSPQPSHPWKESSVFGNQRVSKLLEVIFLGQERNQTWMWILLWRCRRWEVLWLLDILVHSLLLYCTCMYMYIVPWNTIWTWQATRGWLGTFCRFILEFLQSHCYHFEREKWMVL